MKKRVCLITFALTLFACNAAESPLKITRDSFGMPLITSGTINDIAHSIGFVQGQDRLWQIFFTVQVANGRGAEYFGSTLVESDILQHQLNYTDAEVQSQIDEFFTDKTKKVYKNFVEGLNEYVAKVNKNIDLMPYELRTLKLKTIPLFTLYDILRTNQFILQQFSPSSIPSYQLVNQADYEVLNENFGQKSALQIFNDINPTSHQIKSPFTVVQGNEMEVFPISTEDSTHAVRADTKEFAQKFQATKKLLSKSGVPTTGSNGQAISPSKSASGNAMIRIAPQPNYNHPSDFYQIRIEDNEVGLRCNYFTIPTFPFSPNGVFNNFGIGVQVGHLPSNDFLFEPKANATLLRTDLIAISGEKPIKLPIYRSISGGWVITNPIDAKTDTILTLRSAFIGKQLRALNAFIEMAFATNLNEVKNTLLNSEWQSDIMLLAGDYADTENNIAAFHTGGWTKLSVEYDRRLPQLSAPDYTIEDSLFDLNNSQGFYSGWNSLFKPGAEGSSDTVSPVGLNRMYWLEKYIQSFDKLTFDDLKNIGKRQFVANSNTPFINNELDYDADLFVILFKERFFKAVKDHPTEARLRAIDLLANYEGEWFDGDILTTTNINNQKVLADVWLSATVNLVLNPYLAGTSREIPAGNAANPAPTNSAAGNSNSLINQANTLSRIFNLATDNTVFFTKWMSNQPSIDEIIVKGLDVALDILGPKPWGKGKRGVYKFTNLVVGPVQSMLVGNMSGCVMVAEFTPSEIKMESILALGQSGEILGKTSPIFNAHSFDQQPFFFQLKLRANPPFIR